MYTQKLALAFWIVTCLCATIIGQSAKTVNHSFTSELVVKFSDKAFEKGDFRSCKRLFLKHT